MSNNSSLSLESQQLIRAYLIKIFGFALAGLTVLAVGVGYLIDDVARQKAYQDAYNQAFDASIDTITLSVRKAATAVANAEEAEKQVSEVKKQAENLTNTLRTAQFFTSTEQFIDKVADNLFKRKDFSLRLSPMESFKKFERSTKAERYVVAGGGSWGHWQEETYCPKNYYVCGLSQKVEPYQGKGDDTALNSVSIICCPLFDEAFHEQSNNPK